MDHPSAHLFAGRLDRTSAARRGSAAHHASVGQVRGVSVAVMMILTIKRNIGGPVVQSSSTTPDGAAKWRNRTYRRFQVADLWTTPPGPRWSRVVQPGPGWSSRSSRGPARPSSPSGQTQRRAERGRQRDRTATVSTVRSGMRRRSQRVSRGGAAHPQAGGQWTRLDHPSLVQGGPGWSRVVQGGPGSAVWEGPSPSSRSGAQSTRNAIPRRLAEYAVWAGEACMQPGLSLGVGRRPGHSYVST